MGLAASLCMAQVLGGGNGDIKAIFAPLQNLGASILEVFMGLVGFGFVGLIIWGALTLGTNRARGLAMIGGGMAGAVLAGLAVIIVSHLTGGSITLS